jgi:predicted phosphodiesterase
MSGLTWLHLSDWHQKGREFDRRVVLDALIKDIKDRAEIDKNLAKIDFIIFSGDIAYSGKPEEYKEAIEQLFKPLLEICELKADRLIMVPGNHDLNRKSLDVFLNGLLTILNSYDKVKECINEEYSRSKILEPFQAFTNFVAELTGQNYPNYSNIREFNIEGKKIAFIGLNSAWACGRHKELSNEVNDRGFLYVGEPQIYDSLNGISSADLKIAVLHHPFEWLNDPRYVETRLMKECDFILQGHQHRPNVEIRHVQSSNCIISSAGTCYDRRIPEKYEYTNAYNYVHLNLNNFKGTIFLRRWSDPRNEWVADVDSSNAGKFEFEIPGKGSDIRIPFVIAAMTKPEADELDENLANIFQDLFENFKKDLQNFKIIEWQSCYTDLRENWKPYIYKNKSINIIVSDVIKHLNQNGCACGAKSCPRINLVNFSKEFFDTDERNGPDARSWFVNYGGILIVDSISLFHPFVLESLRQSGVLKSDNVAVLVLSPIHSCILSPNQFIVDLIRKHMITEFDDKSINLVSTYEKGIRDANTLQRWLFSTLPELRAKLQNNTIEFWGKMLRDNVGKNEKGFGDLIFRK